jgi:hypothetical protein
MQMIFLDPGEVAWLTPETDEDREFLKLASENGWSVLQAVEEAAKRGLIAPTSRP